MTIEITEAATVDAALVEGMARLLPQLSASAAAPSDEYLRRVLAAPGNTLLVARDRNDAQVIVGMLTLVMVDLPSGTRAQIHDVVVDASARGAGIAEKLTRHALGLARARGASRVDLTSRPSREAANRLYPRVGFKRHETNVYRYTWGDDVHCSA
jgi:ribosomal protein S18 acetylase RimI-like enzyme